MAGVYQLKRLRPMVRPFQLHWFSRLRSSNDQAAALRRRGRMQAPALVLAGRQTAGRGRGGNTWWSGPGSITVTFVLPIDEDLQPFQVPLVAGLAVRQALAEACGTDALRLKWPNDVVWEGRKLAGLLCERVIQADLVGIGVNVNVDPADAPRALRPRIGSLLQITGRRLDPGQVLATIAQHLARAMARRRQHPWAALQREYDRYHMLVGQEVTVVGEQRVVAGRCEGVDPSGRLLVRTGEQQLAHVMTGHVELHRPAT